MIILLSIIGLYIICCFFVVIAEVFKQWRARNDKS